MLIYLFAEHYPNPYKPQFDTEFAYFVRAGHEIRIFATGSYLTTVHPRVRRFGLDRLTSRFPSTLRTLPAFAHRILARVVLSPADSLRVARRVWSRSCSARTNLLRVARALVFPVEAPDLVYIHNIATANYLDFLRELYPTARHMLYYHGGEVGGVKRVERDGELLRANDVVVTNSGFSRTQAIARGAPSERTFVVPVGFDLEDYPPEGEARSYRPDGVLRLISIGRLSEEKGLLRALEAVDRLHRRGKIRLRYTLIGEGLQAQELRRFVTERGLTEQVEFVGEQDKAGVVEHLWRSDVLLLPSLVTSTWAETQAAVVQEAMFTRALVIATRAGGVPESMAPDLRTYLVPPDDSDAIVAMIERVAALDDSEIEAIARASRRFAVQRFSVDSCAPLLVAHGMGDADGTAAQASAAFIAGDG